MASRFLFFFLVTSSSFLLVFEEMSTEVRTLDVTGALWCLPPVLCGLAASEASRPVYLSVSFFALPEGPRGAHRGSDGSTAGPCSYDPPGPVSACLSASAACTSGHRRSSRRSCRVPGLFSLILFDQILWRRARRSQSCQEACCSAADLIISDLIAQLGMDKESHTCSHTCHLLYSHTDQNTVCCLFFSKWSLNKNTILISPHWCSWGQSGSDLNIYRLMCSFKWICSLSFFHTETNGSLVLLQEMQENVKKCKNFLATLIKLASHNSPSPETSKNVKALVQDLLVSSKTMSQFIQDHIPGVCNL